MWSIWHKAVAVNEWGRKLHRQLFLNNAFFVFLILVSRSSTTFMIVSKLGGLGIGPPISCINFMGSGPAIITPSIELKSCSGMNS